MAKAVEKRFTIKCPVCGQLGLPTWIEQPGYRIIHSGRIATCFVEEGTDAAESIRTDFNGAFGTNVTSIATRDVTDEISTLTEWSKTLVVPIDPISDDEWERYRDICYRHAYPQIDTWEGEGGYIHLATHPR